MPLAMPENVHLAQTAGVSQTAEIALLHEMSCNIAQINSRTLSQKSSESDFLAIMRCYHLSQWQNHTEKLRSGAWASEDLKFVIVRIVTNTLLSSILTPNPRLYWYKPNQTSPFQGSCSQRRIAGTHNCNGKDRNPHSRVQPPRQKANNVPIT